MIMNTVCGVLLPFLGTASGSAGVFFVKKRSRRLQMMLSGFAAGVMTAACVWSLLIPSIEGGARMGRWAFVPALTGLVLGFVILTFLDRQALRLMQKLNIEKNGAEVNSFVFFLAVTIHNIPEGMAVGMMYASLISGSGSVTAGSALMFALAIALQNIPEGAIISMPLHSQGMKKSKAFLFGALSGVVEPVGAVATLFVTRYVSTVLPYFFGFAAGAMLFVVADELIAKRENSSEMPVTALSFGVGFALMMVMDVALG
ncbi:MAG: ZIP family metal transporter [Clostridia bacterium]|nr:ZIP family metal transporter [Clostridia bacterium]